MVFYSDTTKPYSFVSGAYDYTVKMASQDIFFLLSSQIIFFLQARKHYKSLHFVTQQTFILLIVSFSGSQYKYEIKIANLLNSHKGPTI
jgi:hypothetical protein